MKPPRDEEKKKAIKKRKDRKAKEEKQMASILEILREEGEKLDERKGWEANN